MRNPLLASSLFGLTGVVLGAFGAHALHDHLVARGTTGTWETAVFYQLIHALALLGVGLTRPAAGLPRWLGRAALAWAAGIVLFSGSLYVFALGGPKLIGAIVPPFGGLCLITGWACVFLHAKATSSTGSHS